MQYLLNRLYSLPQQTPTIELFAYTHAGNHTGGRIYLSNLFQFFNFNQIQLLKAIAKRKL